MVMIFTWPSTTGFQRGDFTLAGVKTVLLCSAHAWNDYSGARHTGLTAPPHRNIQKKKKTQIQVT